MRMDSSAVIRGREISCVEWDTFVVHPPRLEVVTCSLTTVDWPVSLERCSAVSIRFGGNAHWTWQLEVIASSRV